MTTRNRSMVALALVSLWGVSEVAGQVSSTIATPEPSAPELRHAGNGALPFVAVAPPLIPSVRSNFDALPAEAAARRVSVARPHTANELTVATRGASTGLRTSCQHAITLWDSYGDGWTGGYIDVYVDGNLALGGVTLSGGFGPETVYIDVTTGAAITTVWTAGSYPTEASYCIYNAIGAELGCDGAAGSEPAGLAVTADCERTGACCNASDGVCSNGVDVDDCASPLEFTLGTLCEELAVPCGDPGACCDDVAAQCTIEYRANCTGRFISGGTCNDFDPVCGEYRPCAHAIVIGSSNRNDWNQGNSYVDVYVDGALTLSHLTINDEPLEQTFTFLAADGSDITTVFTWASGWTEPLNAQYCIYDGSGALLGCDGLNSSLPTGITVAGVCQGTGACCNPYDGTCTDDVDVWACLPPMHYTAGTACVNLPVPCGNPGACCDQVAGVCTEEYELNCDGRFQAGVTCATAEFVPPCGAYDTCNVLIVPAETATEYLSGSYNFMDLLSGLTYSNVDYMDGTVTTPTLAQLQAYDMVITYADSSYADKHLLGDVLADYVDGGGRVLIGNYAVYTQGNLTWLDGRIIEQYNPAVVAAPNNYGVTYQEDGTDCIFDNVGEYYALGSDVIHGVNGPAYTDGTYYDPDPWAAMTYAPVAAMRYDRTVTYVSAHTAGYVMFDEADRQELAQLTANICYCEPDETLLGACCDPFIGTCGESVAVTDCMPPLQWTPGATCAEIPACGNPGACCDDASGMCTETYEFNCAGRFLAGETCATAAFDPPCGQSGLYDILYAPTSADSPTFRAELAEVLNSNVTYYDARLATPTLAELMQYEAVITWTDYPYADATGVAMGDVLADYVDAGGRVILGMWAISGGGQYNSLQGRLAEEYNPVYIEGMDWQGGDYDGSGTDCIHDGITFYGTPWRDLVTAVTPAAWYDGILLDSYGETSIAVAYLLDRSVYYVSGFEGGTSGPGQWVELFANIMRCPPSDVLGACCDPSDGSCTSDVRKQDCLPPLQWTFDTACGDLEPGCGMPGACCDETTSTCTETVFEQCSGRFIPGETCATAAFTPPCGGYEGCQHSITLYDENPPQYGWFGWIDASVDVYVGGLPRYFGLTMVEGEGSKTLHFDAAEGEAITTVWHPGWLDGAWDHLAAYCIHGLDGTTLACDGEGSSERPAGITTAGSCVPLVCGDGNCQYEGGESCADCPADCGTCRCPSQPVAGGPAFGSDIDCDYCDPDNVQILADNFSIYEPTTLTAVRFWGMYDPGTLLPTDAFTVTIRQNWGSYPGAAVVTIGPVAGTRTSLGSGVYEYTIAADDVLDPGAYWLEIYNDTAGSTETWGWYDGTADIPYGSAGAAYTKTLPEDWSLGAFDMSFELECGPVLPVPGDLDGDRDVDLVDYGLFAACLNGPETPYPSGCDLADLDVDGDVDLDDFGAFSRALGLNQ